MSFLVSRARCFREKTDRPVPRLWRLGGRFGQGQPPGPGRLAWVKGR